MTDYKEQTEECDLKQLAKTWYDPLVIGLLLLTKVRDTENEDGTARRDYSLPSYTFISVYMTWPVKGRSF